MTFPSSGPLDPRAAPPHTAAGSRSSRSQQFAWGSTSQHSARRDLTPISTAFASSNPTAGRPAGAASEASSQQPLSPITGAHPPASAAANLRNPASRTSSISSSSPWSPVLAGSQQLPSSQLLPSARSRTIASAPNNPSSASSAAALPPAAQVGGGGASGGGGGASRDTGSSPSLSIPHSSIASPSNTSNPASAQGTGQGGLSRIIIAQVFLLLSTIKEGGGAQAEQLKRLIDESSMEVFPKYFRRLVQNNSAQIFPGPARDAQNPATYAILAGEMQKVTQDPEQADKIAESLDASDPELFKDFDLSTFMDHFKLEPMAKTTLALACKNASKPDLRSKADAIIFNNYQAFLVTLTSPSSPSNPHVIDDLSPVFIASLVERFLQSQPRNFSEENKTALGMALRIRYQKLNVLHPPEICRALLLMEFYSSHNPLIYLLQRTGPRATSSLDACKGMLESAETRDIDYQQVANVLLFMVISQHSQNYKPATFIAALREHRAGQRLDWQDVVHSFDRDLVRVTKEQFLALYNALLPLALEYENFDIQLLWGGKWRFPDAQLSFVTAFLKCNEKEIDTTQIPRLRKSFDLNIFEDASDDVKAFAEKAATHPMVSLEASAALFNIVFSSSEAYNHAHSLGIPDTIINRSTDVFLVATAAAPKPWGDLQELAIGKLIGPYLTRELPQHSFVLHGIHKQNKVWLATQIISFYQMNPLNLLVIMAHVEEHNWFDPYLSLNNDLSLDLALLAHGRGSFDAEPWVRENIAQSPKVFPQVLCRFLVSRAENEMQIQRDRTPPLFVPLTLKTVHKMILLLQEHISDDETVALHRSCIQSYPRLVNYGEGFDDVLDASSKESNAIPDEIDVKMQEHYKKMYNEESEVRDIIGLLQKYKVSREPEEQDLFACMIHGLFDEYNCFGEYPQDALAKTAVLFGGIIQFDLLSRIALQAALGMVLDAVAVSQPEDLMYKFGLQALLDFSPRFPEWPNFCERLLQIPGLQGTQIAEKANDVVLGNRLRGEDGETNGTAHETENLANGRVDDFLAAEPTVPPFSCIHVDPPVRADLYEEPDEEVQDKVLFVLNNVSERNLEVKLKDIKEALEDKHHQWFANYLVEERAKLQPNFQQLYLELLQQFNDKILWAEVLRETYVSVVRMLNAQATVDSSTERRHLHHLGSWLGSLTIARDKPIKFKNISFKDLLIEGFDTQRLIVVIPFTCKVLTQGMKSLVFKPPNPWIMEIVGLLVELYHNAELKLNLKFEIEVLCKELGLDHTKIKPSNVLATRQTPEETGMNNQLTDGIVEGFADMSFPTMDGARAGERLNGNLIRAALADLPSILSFPPASHGDSSAQLQTLLVEAVKQAMLEIISPVVERSVTIASISTSQLVGKDFAIEGDETKYRDSSNAVVKSLAGSLALVTCKEPLRMAISNNIRVLGRSIASEGLAEGIILMFTNDNIDLICNLVEQAAEAHSHQEIARQMEDGIQLRIQHRAQRPNQPFVDHANLNQWSTLINEPYKLKVGASGLNQDQLNVYKEFGRQTRGMPSHAMNVSQDSGRQVPDVLQEQFPAMPNLATPSEAPAVARQPQSQRLQPVPPVHSHHGQPQINGYMEPQSIADRSKDLLTELQHAIREAPEEHINDFPPSAPTRQIFGELIKLLDNDALPQPQRDAVIWQAASDITQSLYSPGLNRLEVEVFTELLNTLCGLSVTTARHVIIWLATVEEDRVFNAIVVANLLKVRLLDIHHIDTIVARAIQNKREIALLFFGELLEELVLHDQTPALRADFAQSFEAVTQELSRDPNREDARLIISRLLSTGTDGPETPKSATTSDQVEYVFEEWTRLQMPGTPEKTITAFIRQVAERRMLTTNEDSILFLRVCMDVALASFEHEASQPNGDVDVAYLRADALASFIARLVQYQAQADGEMFITRAQHLEPIVGIVILLIFENHDRAVDRHSQKVFFRLFSTLLFELNKDQAGLNTARNDCMLVLANAFVAVQPRFAPGFAFGWQSIISHRVFLPAMLKMPDHAGWEPYLKLFEILLTYAGELVKPLDPSQLGRDFYRGVLRILLVMHHDFPEFLAENHFRLCNVIPVHCTQLRNLVISAFPSSFSELPDPFTIGLKVDRFEEARKTPVIRGDVEGVLNKAHIKETLDEIFASPGQLGDESVSHLLHVIDSPSYTQTGLAHAPVTVDTVLLHAIVLYLGFNAISTAASKGATMFTASSPHAKLLERLAHDLSPEGRHYLLSAIVNQLRYPNSHTHYFSYALLHLFKTPADNTSVLGGNPEAVAAVQQQITKVLLERLLVHRPHPWGLIITLLEILKNPEYNIWGLDFIKAAPEVERTFTALLQHINGSPRPIG
ncbi:MAG: hypothetical protein M1822_002628 [Bathelium mastoideum]|nr:MAG: hypothetical protein M1822_002628 [Bathelium mastoideum]